MPITAAHRIAKKLGLDFEEFLSEHGHTDEEAHIPAGTLVAWFKAKIRPQGSPK